MCFENSYPQALRSHPQAQNLNNHASSEEIERFHDKSIGCEHINQKKIFSEIKKIFSKRNFVRNMGSILFSKNFFQK